MGFGKKRSNKVGVGAITTSKKKLFAEGGMMDDGKDVDPVSGNDVPVGSLAEEVRDDVDAKLSPGEFVFPADVVRFIGLERLMQMRDQAKKGLTRMNDIGQMGNAEEAGDKADDAYEEEDDDKFDKFESDIDEIIKDVDKEEMGRQTEQAFAAGGFVNQSYYDLTKAPKNPALDIRYFKDSAGKDFYMPFINGKPMKPMPNGAVQIGEPTKTESTETKTSRGDAGGAAAGAGAIGVIAGTRDLTGSLTPNVSKDATTTKEKTVGETWGTDDVYGTYTGSNLADFGRADMIYNPGGSGAAGEIMGEDLYQGLSQSEVKVMTTIASSVASAMGIPAIATLPARLAINKFGADKYNEYIGRVNQEKMGRASGIDATTLEGSAAAASQIDQTPYKEASKGYTPQPAASSGAIGTGGIAANASKAVADSLRNTGLSDADIGNIAQRAADDVVRGVDINTAVKNAKTAAVDSIYANKILNGENVTRQDIADAISGKQFTGTLDDFGDLEGGTLGGGLGDADGFTEDFYETDDVNVRDFDFWGTMDEEEDTKDNGFFDSGPIRVREPAWKKKFFEER